MYNILTNNENLNINNKDTLNKIKYLCTDGHHAYNEVANHPLFKDNIEFHIVSKRETCKVESCNSSRRDRLARLKRRSKAYSKSQNMLDISVNFWVNKKEVFENVEKYCLYKSEKLYNDNYETLCNKETFCLARTD